MGWPARCAMAALLFVLSVQQSSTADLPRIGDDPNRNYTLYNKDDDTVCLYASFDMHFMVVYNIGSDSKSVDFRLPPSNEIPPGNIGGVCNSSLDIRWTNSSGTDLGLTLNFSRDSVHNTWTIERIAFSFVINNSTITTPIVYSTSGKNILNRTYHLNQYFYCESCKTFYLRENDGENNTEIEPCDRNTSVCSTVDMTKAVIYPGDIEKQGMKKRICIEDYIALQEIIVPVVVGGILAFLLVVIFVSYIIAYFRRRRKESRQYEPVTGDI